MPKQHVTACGRMRTPRFLVFCGPSIDRTQAEAKIILA